MCPPEEPAASAGTSVRILLIEDSKHDAELFREFMTDADVMQFDITHVERLSTALEVLEREEPDVIFLDFKLPDGDGFQSLQKLADAAPRIPVVMLTGLNDDAVGVEAIENGAQDYLVKGEVDDRTLWRVLRHAIARKNLEEHRRDKRRLQNRVQQAQRAESLMVLAGGIAHEYNNLLTGIMGNVALALTELPSTSPTRALLYEIQLAATRASQLTNQMLTYSGKQTHRGTRIDLSRFVLDVKPLIEAALSPYASPQYDLTNNALTIIGDAAQLQQVAINLVSNASEALGDTPGTVTVSTSSCAVKEGETLDQSMFPATIKPGHYAQLSVTDTGCGIEKNTLARIFDPFFTTKFTGRGLGLASVLGIVRSHGGAIRVHSTPSVGTRFDVLLPLEKTPAASPAEPGDAKRDAALIGDGSGRVLLVDEEELILSVNRSILQGCGLDVVTARTPEEALTTLEEKHLEPDVIVFDVALTQSDVESRLEELSHARPAARVLITSALPTHDITKRLGQRELVHFLQKPYLPDALVDQVQSLL